MSVTITVPELAGELGYGDGVAVPPEPVNGRITRHLAGAIPIIETWANDPTCTDAVHNLGTMRYVGYMMDQPTATANISFANAMVNSGAAAAMRQWRIEPIAVIDGA